MPTYDAERLIKKLDEAWKIKQGRRATPPPSHHHTHAHARAHARAHTLLFRPVQSKPRVWSGGDLSTTSRLHRTPSGEQVAGSKLITLLTCMPPYLQLYLQYYLPA